MKRRCAVDKNFVNIPVPIKTGTRGEMMALGIKGITWLRFESLEDRRFAEDLFTALEIRYSMASDVVLGVFDSVTWKEVLGAWFEIEGVDDDGSEEH